MFKGNLHAQRIQDISHMLDDELYTRSEADNQKKNFQKSKKQEVSENWCEAVEHF